MSYVSDVKKAIREALANYECRIEYTRRAGDRCAYFTVYIDDEWDWDWIENDIDAVCSEFNMWIDDDSRGSFDLCVNS